MKKIKEIFRFAVPFIKKQKKYLILLMIVAFLSSLISAVEPNIFGCIIDESGKENIDNIKLLIILLIFILLGQSFFTYIANRLQLKIGTSIEIDLKKKVFSSILNMPVEKFNRLEKGQLMNNISDDINMFSNLFTTRLLIIIDILSFFVILTILLNINMNLTLILLINAPIAMVLFKYYGKKVNLSELQLKINSDKLSTFTQEVFAGFSIIKSNLREKVFTNEYHKKNTTLYETGIKKHMYNYIADFYSQTSNNITYIILIIFGIIYIKNGSLSIGELVAFSTYSTKLTSLILDLIKINTEIEEAVVSVERIKNIQSVLTQANEKISNGTCEKMSIDQINLINFSYGYLNNNDIIENINLQFDKGHIYYLIGKNGSGKSTLINILSGLYTNYTGDFNINKNYNFRNINQKEYREKIGYISQRTEMFSGTILDNITLFNCDITKERVIKVCKTVGIHDDIMNLEMGYNTFYGAEGISLSGGQIQKIGIARALLKNADVYLCDEIYASLDKESVQNIKNVILQLSKKHIVIVIDHINDNFLSENLVKIFVNDKLTLYKC